MKYYLIFKSIHVTSVLLSFILFITRSYWLWYQPRLLNNKAIKRLPHLIDSVLLFSALLMITVADLSPGSNHQWLTAKITAMLMYILTGLYLFRKAQSRNEILFSLLLAIVIFAYIVHTAITKNIIPFVYS